MTFPRKSFWNVPLLLTIVGLSPLAASLRADTVVRDEFGLKSRTAGATLHDSPVEKGNPTWEASANLIFGPKGTVVVKNSSAFVGRVNVLGTPKIITVEADVFPVQNASEPGFMAMGVGRPKLGSPLWGGGIYVTVFSSGKYTCFYNPEPEDWTSKYAVSLQAGDTPEFIANGKTRLKLQYNQTTRSYSVWLNGDQVVQDKILDAGQTVSAEFAGFSGFRQEEGKTVATKFVLTTSP